MPRSARNRAVSACALLLPVLPALSGCGRSYSPDAYVSSAVQQANKAEQGTVAGVRRVRVNPDGTTGAVAGGAAGGVVGSQAPGGTLSTALGAVGGTLVGGLVGSAAEQATGRTDAFEYIVRKGNGELVSVTQKDTVPLFVGQKVLVIEGSQARVVPDYTAPPDPGDGPSAPPAAAAQPPAQAAPQAATAPSPSPAGAAPPPAPASAAPGAASPTLPGGTPGSGALAPALPLL